MRALAVSLLVAVALAGTAPAQTPYYAGKAIELLVPTAVGGATDILARFFAPFLERHIPGNPSIRIRNMPGGGTLLGMNWFAANAKADGTMMLASTVSSQVAYILRNPAVRYEFRKLKAVLVNGSGAVFYASPQTGLRRARDLAGASGLTFGSLTPPGVELPALLAFELLGVQPKVVFGFESRGPIRLAFERGELNLDFQATFVYASQVLPLVRQGKAVPLMTLGFIDERGRMVRDPSVPDLPTVYEVYQQIHGLKPDGLLRWKAYAGLVAASWTYGRALWVPEGTPEEALRDLRAGVDRMTADPEFRRQAEQVLGPYPVLRGDRVEQTLHRNMTMTLDVVKYIRETIRTKYNQHI
ncbi:MAG: hypothetical protein RMM30_11395 [Armatimonadota bacterium]|nr:hypothetical protein [Armatimonadota bacterium]MDW8157175.1 hypothetical protein [Armatimonadota bacterium]